MLLRGADRDATRNVSSTAHPPDPSAACQSPGFLSTSPCPEAGKQSPTQWKQQVLLALSSPPPDMTCGHTGKGWSLGFRLTLGIRGNPLGGGMPPAGLWVLGKALHPTGSHSSIPSMSPTHLMSPGAPAGVTQLGLSALQTTGPLSAPSPPSQHHPVCLGYLLCMGSMPLHRAWMMSPTCPSPNWRPEREDRGTPLFLTTALS